MSCFFALEIEAPSLASLNASCLACCSEKTNQLFTVVDNCQNTATPKGRRMSSTFTATCMSSSRTSLQRLSYSMFPKFYIAAPNAAQELSPGDKGSHGTAGVNVVTNTPRRPVQEVSPSKYDELGRLSRPSNLFYFRPIPVGLFC